MSLSYYVIDHVLHELYQGKNAAYASALNVNRSNLRKTLHKMYAAKGNSRLMEQTLEMLIQNDLDYMRILEISINRFLENSDVGSVCDRDDILLDAKNAFAQLEGVVELAAEHALLLKKTAELVRALEQIYCGRNDLFIAACAHHIAVRPEAQIMDDQVLALPCIKLHEFVESLRAMLSYLAQPKAID